MQNYTAEYELFMKYQYAVHTGDTVCVWSLQPEQSSKDWKLETNNHLLVSQSKNGTGTGTLTNRKRKVEIGEGENFRIANATDICQSRKPSQQVNNNLQIFSPMLNQILMISPGYLIPSVTDFRRQMKLTVKVKNQFKCDCKITSELIFLLLGFKRSSELPSN